MMPERPGNRPRTLFRRRKAATAANAHAQKQKAAQRAAFRVSGSDPSKLAATADVAPGDVVRVVDTAAFVVPDLDHATPAMSNPSSASSARTSSK